MADAELSELYSTLDSNSWDHNLETLYALIMTKPNKESLLREVNQILVSGTKFVQKPQRYCYDVIAEWCEVVHHISIRIRQNLNLPLDRPCLAKFSSLISESLEEKFDSKEKDKKKQAKPVKKSTPGKKEEQIVTVTESVPIINRAEKEAKYKEMFFKEVSMAFQKAIARI